MKRTTRMRIRRIFLVAVACVHSVTLPISFDVQKVASNTSATTTKPAVHQGPHPAQALQDLQKEWLLTLQIAKQLFSMAPNQHPSASNLTKINAFFGKSGLDINALPQEELDALKDASLPAPDIMGYITQLYYYMELLHTIATINTQQEALRNKIQNASPKDEAALRQQLNALEQQLTDYQEGKKKPSLSGPELAASELWQNYLKFTITDSYNQDYGILKTLYQQEVEIFKYTPNIEVEYYQPDYTHLRNMAEFARIHLILSENLRSRLIPQCAEWADVLKKKGEYAVYQETQTFKKSQFFTLLKAFENFSSDLTELKTSPAVISKNSNGSYTVSASFQDMVETDTQTGGITVVPSARQFISIKEDGGQPNIYVTPLFTLLFSVSPSGSLSPNDNYKALFATKTIQASDSNGTPTYSQKTVPTLLYQQILCMAMLKILRNLTKYIYSRYTMPETKGTTYLAHTMNYITQNKSSIPEPNILLYEPEDQFYLHDLNSLMAEFEQQFAPDVKVQSFWSWLCGIFDAVGNFFKHLWGDIKKFFVNVGEAIWNGLKGIWYSSGLATVFQHIPYATAAKMGTAFFNAASKDINGAFAALTAMVNQVVKTMTTIAGQAGKIVGAVVGFITGDKKLTNDIEHAFVYAAKLMYTWETSMTKEMLSVWHGIVNVTFSAVEGMSEVLGAVVGHESFSKIMGTLGDSLENFGETIATSMLSTLSCYVNQFKDMFEDCIKLVGYVVSALTQIFIEVSSLLVAIGTYIVTGNMKTAENMFHTVHHALEQHQRIISAVITTALSIAAAPFTGGASIGMVVMNVGMGAFQIASAVQQDQESIVKKHRQEAFLQKFETYVDNEKKVVPLEQSAFTTESQDKFNAYVGNQERGLKFYQDYLNSTFNTAHEQVSDMAGTYYSAMLSSSHGSIPQGDPGSDYGIQTGRYYLDPSEGFVVYNEQRQSFAQEIAVGPQSVAQPSSTFSHASDMRFWFLQKDIRQLDHDAATPLTAQIRWRIIYDLDSPYHIGLYLGGQPLNAQETIKNKQANIDMAHLAKMFVCHRSSGSKPAKLGVYEHETAISHAHDGWLPFTAPDITFTKGQWYYMSAELNGNKLNVACWQEGSSEPQKQTITVTPTNQNMMGVIFSGASVEYQILEPKEQCTPDKTVRKPLPYSSVKKSELLNRTQQQIIKAPKVGAFVLTPASSELLLKLRYLYTTKSTKLKTNAGSSLSDYVLCADYNGQTVSNIGMSPTQKPTAIVSLVTNNAYDATTGLVVAHCKDVRKAFQSHFGALDAVTQSQIAAQTNKYLESLEGPFTFGSLSLKSTLTLIQEQQFIYTSPSPTPEIKGKTDYFIMSNLSPAQTPSTWGMAYNASLPAVISLVTGDVYTRTESNKPTVSGYRTILSKYQSEYGTLPVSVAQDIKNMQKVYKNAYDKSIKGPYTFGSLTLTLPLANSAHDHYIYESPSDTPEMKGKTDYFLMTDLNNNAPTNWGILYTHTTKGVISLVTGDVFDRTNTATPVNTGYANLLSKYQKIHGTLSPSLLNAITTAQSAYQKALSAQKAAAKAAAEKKAEEQAAKNRIVVTTTTSMAPVHHHKLGGFGIGSFSPPPAPKSFGKRLKKAAGGFGFGGFGGGFGGFGGSSSNSGF